MTGKYGLFIWGSYALAALVLGWNLLAPLLARRSTLRRLRDDAVEGIDGDVTP